MIVQCLTTKLTAQQQASLRTGFAEEAARQLEVGRHYLVIGLHYDVGSILWGTGAWVQLCISESTLVAAPLHLFCIIDGKPSQYWETRLREDGSLTLWPPSFYQSYYQGDLARGVPSVVEDYGRVVALLAQEAEVGKRDTQLVWPVRRADP